jgi:hypothetical protein
MFRYIYAQLLYWAALRLQVTHPVLGDLNKSNTKLDLLKLRLGSSLMARSNSIILSDNAAEMRRFKERNKINLLMRSIAYNPTRKDPVDPIY